ncbi:TPR/MLP1/MLP2-like protein [Elsinoe fawcettii]|nr:TPR/MLP1/MLP2-like protein [Elsinoe fawcettii]
MRTRAQAGVVVDVAVISASFGVEEDKLQIALDAPTAELVRELLSTFTVKAQEFDDAKAEKLRADVELENTVRNNEAKSKAVKSSLTKSQKEVESLRKTISSLENGRSELQSEIDRVKSSSTDSSTEVETLQARIASLETSNRETLSVLETKSSAHDKLAEELAEQHQKILALRREISSLEDKNQSLENAASSAKFKEQGLVQESELLKRNVEWHEQELKTRTAEQTKFRKEKNARISELQRANEDANSTIEAFKRTETALRQRLDEVSQKAEDAFAKIQKLQETAIESESAFKVELDSARRLADLQKQSADTARARLQEVTANLEQIKDAAAEEIGQLQAEIETEQSEKEALDGKLRELEAEVERLQTSQSQQQASAPGTPARSTNGLAAMTPIRGNSPAPFTPGTVRSKGNLNITQLYSENVQLRTDLETERRRTSELSNELDQMIQDLETRGPEQDDLRQDKERIEAEVVEMSSLLDAALADRDTALQEARSKEGQVAGLSKEGEVLRQQLRDLSAQIKILLVEMQAREQGLDGLDVAGQAQLQMLAAGELDEDSVSDQTSAGALITQRLLLFRNVAELQEQNTQLLKLNRGLADRMEGQEAKAREVEQADRDRELDDLRQRVQQHEDEVRALTTQTQSITRERDMFRRMLASRGPIPGNADVESLFGQSVNGDGPPRTPLRASRLANDDPEGLSKQLADHVKLVKEMQMHLDTTRQELSTDRDILRKQVDQLAKEKSEMQSELARSNGQVSLAQERYDMLQANYRMLQSENGEMQKRAQALNESAAKQDLRIQQVAEELVDAKALADSMRGETANLKAERELWKKIESRLTEDNRLLMDERSRLNKMLSDLQNLQNEREQTDSETRRRLQSRIDGLESELSSVRKKLELEAEESKKAHLRREYEQDQAKTRIDDLVKSLSNVREELVAAKTTRDQLQVRVDEMKIDLRNAEERAQALQPRPSSGGPLTLANGGAEAEPPADSNLSREQELGLEVADLKRDLDFAKAELESVRAQVEQYKAISQSAEEELQSFNETNDQYKEDMDRQLEEKEGAIQQLEERIQDLSTELSATNAELSEVRTQHEQSGMQLEEQKTVLESEVARLRDECERQTEKAKLHQADLKAQAEIAQQAQQSYEDELVKHADAARNLQGVRTEYNALRTEVAGIRAEAEAAKTSLAQGQENWSELKDRYEQELNELRNSRDDLKSQNKLVHEQLESVSSQISTLQQYRAQPAEDDEATGAQTIDSKLQEVVSYLRREKEIIDVQYELAVQESKRLKQQLDYTQSQLDDTRTKLSEERRERTNQETGAASHTKLLETINELNLYRESSATLRQETRQAQAKLQERIKEVEDLTAQVLPLQSKIQELESEMEMKNGELRLLQEDRDRWRERTNNIISKYDRVDPAEIEAMKSRITEAEAERDQLQNTIHELQQQMESFPVQMQQVKDDADKAWQEQKAKFVEQAKSRSREQGAKISAANQDLAAVRAEKEKLEQDLVQSQQDLEEAKTQRDIAVANQQAAIEAAVKVSGPPAENIEEGQVEEGEVASGGSDSNAADLEARAQAAESRAAQASARVSELESQAEILQTTIQEQNERIQSLEQQVVSPTDFLDQSHAKFEQVELEQSLEAATSNAGAPHPQADNSEEVQALQQQLATAQQDLESLRARAGTSNEPGPETASEPAASARADTAANEDVAAQVAAQVEQLKSELEQQHELSKQQLEQQYQTRTTKMKETLNNKLREERQKMKQSVEEEVRQQLITQHSDELQKLRQAHEDEILRLKEEHNSIVEKVTREGAAAVEKARTSVAVAPPATPTKPSTTESASAATPTSAEGVLTITDEQARALIAKNEIIRSILKRNITAKVEAEGKRLKEEHEKVIKEKEEAAEAAKLAANTALTQRDEASKAAQEQAVAKAITMEASKQKVKLSMADGRARTANAKLEIVESAAKETPERPVGEVWEIAKSAKPAPAPKPAAPAVASAVPLPVTTAPTQAAASQAPPAAEPAMPATSVTAVPGEPATEDEQSRLAARQARFGAPSALPAPGGSFGKPSFGAPSTTTTNVTTTATTSEVNGTAGQDTTSSAANGDNPNAADVKSGPATIVRGGGIPRAGGTMLPRAGATAGRGRGNISGIAAPGGQTANTTGIPGRGGGIPRGGFRGAPSRGGRGGGPASPLNAGAKQFTPGATGAVHAPPHGAKRPLEGGEQGDGKRIRGGGPAA